MLSPSLQLFDDSYPADPLIARQRRQSIPGLQHFRRPKQYLFQVFRNRMHDTRAYRNLNHAPIVPNFRIIQQKTTPQGRHFQFCGPHFGFSTHRWSLGDICSFYDFGEVLGSDPSIDATGLGIHSTL